MKCLVLASGFGTRLYPLTERLAKPLLPYKGKPVLSHIVEKISPRIDTLVSANRKFESDFCSWRKTVDRTIEICVEDVWIPANRKGAVGSLKFWIDQKKISEDLIVIAGDNYFEFDLEKFISAYDGRKALVAVCDIGDKAKARQFGVVRIDGDSIVDFEEKPAIPKTTLVATACYILPPFTFPHLSRYYSAGNTEELGGFIAYLAQKNLVNAYIFSEFWADIGEMFCVT